MQSFRLPGDMVGSLMKAWFVYKGHGDTLLILFILMFQIE